MTKGFQSIILFILLLLFSASASGQGVMIFKDRQDKLVRASLQYSTLNGIGFGISVHPSRKWTFESLFGVYSPVNLFRLPAYKGNQFNLTLSANYYFLKNHFVALGGYMGHFDLTHDHRDYYEVKRWVAGPMLAWGATLSQAFFWKVDLLTGVVGGLPKTLTATTSNGENEIDLEIKRDFQQAGAITPFLTLICRF